MIRILTDSASDILPAEAEQLGVTVIPLNVTLEDGSILRDGIDMTPTAPALPECRIRWRRCGCQQHRYPHSLPRQCRRSDRSRTARQRW